MAQRILTDALIEGNVQSFVELFYLTNRKVERLETPMSDALLEEVAKEEAAAEAGRRRGDSAAAINAFMRIAEIHKQLESLPLQCVFLERAIEIARATGATMREMHALHALGESKAVLGDLAASVRCHEAHRTLAGKTGEGDHSIQANAQLVKVYTRQAHEAEQRPASEGLVESHRLFVLALSAARQCGDIAAEARGNYDVGRALVLLHRPKEAVPYLKNFVSVAAIN
jgi:hypothetical protein